MSLLPGDMLAGYRIVAPLGEGGMARVYKAFQPSLERHVAVKVLSAQVALDAGFQARFRREAVPAHQLLVTVRYHPSDSRGQCDPHFGDRFQIAVKGDPGRRHPRCQGR